MPGSTRPGRRCRSVSTSTRSRRRSGSPTVPVRTADTGSELKTTGGGFGLQGMRERIELLGGQVVAEPSALGWTVQVAVPV